ncbi:GNAT family N-acetyltransferase [Aquipuribacter sp. SD81]|uniref:GNAT family N-acetyltransferase n=1 Tax=Aquipuribacter sp. SD81 TaxID=3127703 RepID=UPI00301ADD29
MTPAAAAVRVATPADVPAVLDLGRRTVVAHYTPVLGAEAAAAQLRTWWTEERLRSAAGSGGLLVVDSVPRPTAEGRVSAMAETGRVDGDVVVWKLYVEPGSRGHGLGSALLRAVAGRVPAGTPRLLLEHFAGNTRAAAFYEREGFRVVRVDADPDGRPEADVVWRARDLTAH